MRRVLPKPWGRRGKPIGVGGCCQLGECASHRDGQHCLRQCAADCQSQRVARSRNAERHSHADSRASCSGHHEPARGRLPGSVVAADARRGAVPRRRMDSRRSPEILPIVQRISGGRHECGYCTVPQRQGCTRARGDRGCALRHGMGKGECGKVQLRFEPRGYLWRLGRRSPGVDGSLCAGLIRSAGMHRPTQGSRSTGLLWAHQSCRGPDGERQLRLYASVAGNTASPRARGSIGRYPRSKRPSTERGRKSERRGRSATACGAATLART